MESRGFEADGSDEGVEIVDDALIEAIELRSPLGFEPLQKRPLAKKHTPSEKHCSKNALARVA